MILSLSAGLGLSAIIGLVGFWRGSLSASGVIGAILIGTLIFGFGGFICGGLLVAFFISSSALSQYRARVKEQLADKFQKGSRRDFSQAVANGGWAAALALAYGISHAPLPFIAFVGALATVTADTWATEIGVLSPQPPRLVTTGRPVPVGSSGGVSVIGTLTALTGAAFIGACAVVLAWVDKGVAWPDGMLLHESVVLSQWNVIVVLAAISGLAGALFDSVLGATVQAIYYCDYDRKETERRIHRCGRAARRVRGFVWMDNEVVNFLSSVWGSLAAMLVWSFLLQGQVR